ncbi:unnamed protein product [Meganyctiphanes norvegica]|uniref:Uncharacterized protein n=1 Tax=Meganyctiphanes norvegica TaxID=48144 RepID=A0AAV2PVL0_MEGNR
MNPLGFLLAFVSALYCQDCSSESCEKLYKKVTVAKFWDGMESSILHEVPLVSKIACGFHCNLLTECRMFCYKGDRCILSGAYVSPHWNASVGQADFPIGYEVCYTSWWVHNDVVATTKKYNSDQYHGKYAPELAIDGFYQINSLSLYVTLLQLNPWVTFEMKESTWVVEVRVATRADLGQFNYVTIYLGDTPVSSYSDLNGYPVFARFNGESIKGEVKAFRYGSNNGMKGKYITFSSNLSGNEIYFAIGELQIISA